MTLIRSVLMSLPNYIFSCMAVPMQVKKHFEGLMTAFLWSQKGQPHTYWVSWHRICKPIDE